MKKDNEIIDLGEWKVPSSWDEITLKTFQEIEQYYEDKEENFDVRDVIHILVNKSIDEINNLPLEVLEAIMEKTVFLQTPFEAKKPSNKVEINGEVYSVHIENKLRVGEYIAADTLIKSNPHNYSGILAILCRKDDELYDSKFENEILEDRIKLWGEQSVTKVMPIISFFLHVYGTSLILTQSYSKVEEAIDLTQQDIENSHRSGQISKRSMKSLMKKLTKLRKSIKCT